MDLSCLNTARSSPSTRNRIGCSCEDVGFFSPGTLVNASGAWSRRETFRCMNVEHLIAASSVWASLSFLELRVRCNFNTMSSVVHPFRVPRDGHVPQAPVPLSFAQRMARSGVRSRFLQGLALYMGGVAWWSGSLRPCAKNGAASMRTCVLWRCSVE